METIITACFYISVGILALLGFALQAGVGPGHFPQAAFSAVLCGVFQCHFHPTFISRALLCPQSSLLFFSCQGSKGFSWSPSLTTQPLFLLLSTAHFQFLSVLSSVSWQQLLPVSPWSQMGQLLLCSWTFRNVSTFFNWFFSKISLRILEIS